MIKSSDGSALIIVIFVTSFLAIASYGFWYKSSLFFDIVLKRELFYKKYYLTETIFEYAKEITIKNFVQFSDKLKSSKKTKQNLNNLIELIDQSAKTSFRKIYTADMILKLKKNTVSSLVLTVNLLNRKNLKSLCCLSCVIEKKGANEKTKNHFIVKNYNLSSAV